ncbi:MAG: hypothetical protein ACOX44_07825 [Limnochordia bacterium]|jgi:hypothetical protein
MRKMFIALIALLLLSGCGNISREQASLPDLPDNAIDKEDRLVTNTTQAQEELAAVLGLQLGRQWRYQGEGNEYAAFIATVVYVKDNYYQIEENNGGTILSRVIALQPDGAYEILTQGEHPPGKNLLNELNASPDMANAKRLLPWPITVGTRWTWPDGSEAEVVAVNQQHDVPFGELNQVTQVRITTVRRISDAATNQKFEETSIVERFYAKDIGLIEQRFTAGEFVVTSRLEKITLTLS